MKIPPYLICYEAGKLFTWNITNIAIKVGNKNYANSCLPGRKNSRAFETSSQGYRLHYVPRIKTRRTLCRTCVIVLAGKYAHIF